MQGEGDRCQRTSDCKSGLVCDSVTGGNGICRVPGSGVSTTGNTGRDAAAPVSLADAASDGMAEDAASDGGTADGAEDAGTTDSTADAALATASVDAAIAPDDAMVASDSEAADAPSTTN